MRQGALNSFPIYYRTTGQGIAKLPSEITFPFPVPGFCRPGCDDSWRKERIGEQKHRVLQRVMVHCVNGNARLDLVGHFSVSDTTKKNPQRTIYQRETSLSTCSEENVSTECLPTGGNPCGMCLKVGPSSLSLRWNTRFYLGGNISRVMVTKD